MSTSLTNRNFAHDYCAPCIYMITVTVRGRRPLLGHLQESGDKAYISESEIGRMVVKQLLGICDYYPQIRLLRFQIMPDHLHFILHVRERIPVPLGRVIRGWKQGVNKEYTKMTAMEWPNAETNRGEDGGTAGTNGSERGAGMTAMEWPNAETNGETNGALFEQGYNDMYLQDAGQLEHMIRYIEDNPRRLAIKRAHAAWFQLQRGVEILPGQRVDMIGNADLLRHPLVAVHCRRKWSAEETAQYQAQCMAKARDGAVLTGAFISDAERMLMEAAYREDLPIIRITDKGFGDYYKPAGRDFDYCSQGLLLFLSPQPYTPAERRISREECVAFNALAETLAGARENGHDGHGMA